MAPELKEEGEANTWSIHCLESQPLNTEGTNNNASTYEPSPASLL